LNQNDSRQTVGQRHSAESQQAPGVLPHVIGQSIRAADDETKLFAPVPRRADDLVSKLPGREQIAALVERHNHSVFRQCRRHGGVLFQLTNLEFAVGREALQILSLGRLQVVLPKAADSYNSNLHACAQLRRESQRPGAQYMLSTVMRALCGIWS